MEPREYGELGLRSAVARLEDAIGRQEGTIGRQVEGEVLVSLAEVLHWSYALDDHHSNGGKRKSYLLKRNADPDGAALAGLIYARKLATHSLATVGELVITSRPQVILGGAGIALSRVILPARQEADFRWRGFGDLPLPGRPEKGGKDRMYEQHLGGRILLEPINEGTRFILGRP